VRSVEQPVNLDDGDDVYNWPWLYAVQTGQWKLTDGQAKQMREYLARGGFFMCDDFWGESQWQNFLESMHRVLPDRPVVDIPDDDPIFHVVYDLSDRYQVPGARYVQTGVTEKCAGCPARWRGIYDDRGRLVVAMDLSPKLRQPVKSQNSVNGELTYGVVTTEVHKRGKTGCGSAAGNGLVCGRGGAGLRS
jgi:hypothetical protein